MYLHVCLHLKQAFHIVVPLLLVIHVSCILFFFLLFVTITEFVPQFTNMSQQFETFRCSDDKAMKKTVHVFLMTYVLVGLKRQGKIRKYIVSQMISAVGKNKAG